MRLLKEVEFNISPGALKPGFKDQLLGPVIYHLLLGLLIVILYLLYIALNLRNIYL